MKSTPPPSEIFWHVSGNFCLHEDNNILLSYNTQIFWIAQNFGHVSGNLWLWSGIFLLYIKITFIYQKTPKFPDCYTFPICVWKYPACVRKFGLYIKIVLFFSPMTQTFPDCFPAYIQKFMACVWKFPDWYKFLECVQKFPACVRKLWSHKNIIFVWHN